jgi:hypothetical protein
MKITGKKTEFQSTTGGFRLSHSKITCLLYKFKIYGFLSRKPKGKGKHREG